MLGAAVGDSAYVWTAVAVAVLTIGGTGGLLGLIRWLKKQGVRDNDADKVRDAVLGTDKTGNVGMEQRLADRLTDEMAKLRHEMRPNGGGPTSKLLGDTVHRTEGKVDALDTKVDQFIGRMDERDRALERRLSAIERECPLFGKAREAT